jgi:mercuric ion transport protein
MHDRNLLKTGIAGAVVAALCCGTPILAVLLGVLGLSAWIGWLDYVLIPALVMFIGITIYALRRLTKDPARHTVPVDPKTKTER